MRVLIDTHALLWALSEPKKLPAKSREILVNPQNSIFVSAASIWEICIKVAIKKLSVKPEAISEEIRALGFEELPIFARHALRLLKLKPYHRDPFDRILVAQAQEEELTLISHDPAFTRYGVKVVWS